MADELKRLRALQTSLSSPREGYIHAMVKAYGPGGGVLLASDIAHVLSALKAAERPQSVPGDGEPTEAELRCAAWAWRNDKDRETDSGDDLYFRNNWQALPGLRDYVEREIAKRVPGDGEGVKAEDLLARAARRTEIVDGIEVWTSAERFFTDHGVIHDRETGKHVRAETFDGLFDAEVSETVGMLNSMWDRLVSLYRDYQQIAALSRVSTPGREEVARVIDPIAMAWEKPWRQCGGFFSDPANGPFREDAIQRDEDRERSEMMRAKAYALAKADAIIALGAQSGTIHGLVGSPPEGGTPSPSDGQVLRAGGPPLGVGPGYRFAGSDAELAAILLEAERDLHAYGDGEPGATYDCALPAYIGEAAARLLKPKHVYWGAGEPDCPREIKAGNGELHTLRCKRCGQDDPRDPICRYGSARP